MLYMVRHAEKEHMGMITTSLVTSMAEGTITIPGKTIQAQDINWAEHPTFKGVYLKHLVRGELTNGQMSCHMVRVDPGCSLESHIHAEQWELHEVITGSGVCSLNGSELPYGAGQVTVIPSGVPHAVTAGDDGLVLLAKFFPALC